MTSNDNPLILASKSFGRQELLKKHGIYFEAIAANIDEESIKIGLIDVGAKPRDIADSLAEAKALKISRKIPPAMVLGSDQILVGPDGSLMSKISTREEAEVQIAKLAGRSHRLISAAVICQSGKPIWRIIDMAKLQMKPLSAQEIIDYVAKYWDDIRHCVGCYRIEAEGRELFESIDGEESTIVGMPMPALLDYLTLHGYGPKI